MAWLEDRVWCHPKFTDVSDRAYRVWTHSLAYSSGFGCKGVLTAGQQKKIGSTAAICRELVSRGLWDEADGGCVYIHDWKDHNAKRDAKRERDVERKRQARAEGRWNEHDRPTSGAPLGRAPSLAPSIAPAWVDTGETVEGLDLDQEQVQDPPALDRGLHNAADLGLNGWSDVYDPTSKLVAAVGGGPDATLKIRRTVLAHRSTEADIAQAIESATDPSADDPLAVALARLSEERTP